MRQNSNGARYVGMRDDGTVASMFFVVRGRESLLDEPVLLVNGLVHVEM